MGTFAYLHLVRIISESHESVNCFQYETTLRMFMVQAINDVFCDRSHKMHLVRRTLWPHAQGPIKIPSMAHPRSGWDTGSLRIGDFKIIGL